MTPEPKQEVTAPREDGLHFIDSPAGLTWCLMFLMLAGIAVSVYAPLNELGKALFNGAFGAFLLKIKSVKS